MRPTPVAVLASITLPLAFTLPASTASAHDYCVAKPRCAGTVVAAAQLQTQLTAAETNGEADRFFLGSAVFARGPYSYVSSEPVELHGTKGSTTVTTFQAAVVDRTVLTLIGPAVSLDGVRIELALSGNSGLNLSGGAARDVSIKQMLGTSVGSGAVLSDGATLADSTVDVLTDGAPAVGLSRGSATIASSRIFGSYGALTVPGADTLTVARSTLTASVGAFAYGGTIKLSDTVVDGRGVRLSAAFFALAQSGFTPTIEATRTTVVGGDATSTNAIGAYAAGNGGTATVTVRDSAMTGVGVPALRVADPGALAMTELDRVAHADPIGSADRGPGSSQERNRLPAPTGFADPSDSDFRLLPGSSLIDAGDPAFTAAADATDRDGAPRLRDGDGDCTARLDVGAYEYQPAGPCTPPTPPVVDPPAPGPGPGPGTPPQQQPPPRAAPDRTAPRLSALRVPARLKPGSALPRLRANRRASAIAFTLSERASVTLRFTRRGRDGRYRAVRGGTLKLPAAAGANRLRFAGRVTRRARLARGRYRVTLTAVDAAGNRSRAATARFRIG
ncbi:choice-of-anchor Q domain-containing protein [Conexibacter stalactiti]|uniref:Choice-of-anchor Q domain-containing protein n=1 Tax=Conexibacter stalactiti TaxID=1940611 RepID=A0ABU4HZ15_9ACTN|nr:choice-of-anchor Q domain-containing protein [Conexibacter stalactiti]MDW5598581.1 choice-of-anchor Q domain-containing protein [Conexibacter stalactiti]MEC5039223.1 choice-of-anchor Q domain-containing protein [Conexibacter stalactiti]